MDLVLCPQPTRVSYHQIDNSHPSVQSFGCYNTNYSEKRHGSPWQYPNYNNNNNINKFSENENQKKDESYNGPEVIQCYVGPKRIIPEMGTKSSAFTPFSNNNNTSNKSTENLQEQAINFKMNFFTKVNNNCDCSSSSEIVSLANELSFNCNNNVQNQVLDENNVEMSSIKNSINMETGVNLNESEHQNIEKESEDFDDLIIDIETVDSPMSEDLENFSDHVKSKEKQDTNNFNGTENLPNSNLFKGQ